MERAFPRLLRLLFPHLLLLFLARRRKGKRVSEGVTELHGGGERLGDDPSMFPERVERQAVDVQPGRRLGELRRRLEHQATGVKGSR